MLVVSLVLTIALGLGQHWSDSTRLLLAGMQIGLLLAYGITVAVDWHTRRAYTRRRGSA